MVVLHIDDYELYDVPGLSPRPGDWITLQLPEGGDDNPVAIRAKVLEIEHVVDTRGVETYVSTHVYTE